jgi:phosphoglycerate kinase
MNYHEMRSHIQDADLYHKIVFVRADLNASSDDSHKLHALTKTLDILKQKNAVIVLATHKGRPKGTYDTSLSTKTLVPHLRARGYDVHFEPDLHRAHKTIQSCKAGQIMLLENLRFHKGEKEQSMDFAKTLHAIAPDYYINDAFGTLHRKDTSVYTLASLYCKNSRSIGLLVEKELHNLFRIKHKPDKPFTLMIGGAKADQKVSLIQSLIETLDTVLLCPALCFTFLKALGKQVGKSLVSTENIDLARKIHNMGDQYNTRIVYPLDYLVAHKSLKGPLSYKDADDIQHDDVGISVGPKTVTLYKDILLSSHTILFNGSMGFLDRKETIQELHSLLQAMAQSDALSVIGGGDSSAAVNMFGLTDQIDIVSTGGGSMLAYLSNKTLPALEALTP